MVKCSLKINTYQIMITLQIPAIDGRALSMKGRWCCGVATSSRRTHRQAHAARHPKAPTMSQHCSSIWTLLIKYVLHSILHRPRRAIDGSDAYNGRRTGRFHHIGKSMRIGTHFKNSYLIEKTIYNCVLSKSELCLFYWGVKLPLTSERRSSDICCLILSESSNAPMTKIWPLIFHYRPPTFKYSLIHSNLVFGS